MAKPRVFISSTFYDLKHIRVDLDRFIEEMGYDPVRNEVGEIPYGSIEHLEEYCYKEVIDVDMLVGIIGNRYGSQSDYQQYSVTQQEIKTAINQGKQVYIFIDKNVNSEYGTYLLNKNVDIKYKYVDDVRVYHFIEEILSYKAGTIVQPFESSDDIILFLKAQWSGLFREFLHQKASAKQYETLSEKIGELSSLTEIIKQYFEKALPSIMNANSAELVIKEENKKLKELLEKSKFENISYISHLIDKHLINVEELKMALVSNNSVIDLIKNLKTLQKKDNGFYCLAKQIDDVNKARVTLGKPPYTETYSQIKEWLDNNKEIANSANYLLTKKKKKSITNPSSEPID